MFELILAFVIGLIVMDFIWAYKLGIVQMLWYRLRARLSRREVS